MNSLRLLLLLLTISFPVFANKKADSLKAVINYTNLSSQKLTTILEFCEENRSYSYDTLNRYASIALNLWQQTNNKGLRAKAVYFKALGYYRKSKLDSVLQITDPILASIANDRGYDRIRNRFKLLKASTYLKQSKHKLAADMFYQVIGEAEKSGDTISQIKGLNGQGWVQMEMGQFEAAKKWFHKGIQSTRSRSDSLQTCILYTNLASCCGALGQLDSAKYYVEKGIALARGYEDLPVQANGLNILASYYIDRKDFDKALVCIKESAEIRTQIGDPFYIVSDMAQLSYLFAKTGRHNEAMSVINKAIDYATQNKIESKLPLLYQVLSQNLYDRKDFKGSADALFRLQSLQDSIYHKASAQSLADMQVKYETSQKEKTIQAQQYELSRKNHFLIGSITLSILVILLAILIVRNRKHKQEVRLQKIILEQQDVAAKSIIVAEENERKRIASDLHDGIGQMLTAARFNLNGISDSMTFLSDQEKLVYEKVVKLLDESCIEVRNVSHSIMPNALMKSGLGNAIKDFIEKIRNTELRIELNTSGINGNIDANVEIMIYRIIQECVNNVLKHSGATKLDISLSRDEDGLNLTIEDNGKGFDLSALSLEKGIGMKNIRTRTHYLKGTVDIDSRPGHGTLVAIHIPAKIKKP
jgi:signal transduction histidine kinase/Tfp pilus assembly protein PilF